jgi:hypothetical protein
MTTSSLPEDFSITLNDNDIIKFDDINTITLTGSNSGAATIGTITFDASTNAYTTYGGGTTYTIGSGISTSTVTLDTSTFNWVLPEEWKDDFPKWGRVQDMCKQYPALEIALRNFRIVYELVKDDYDNPTPKR